MLRMAISYRKRQAAKALAFNADELYTRLIQELDRAKIFVAADSSAATASSKSHNTELPPSAGAASKKEETSQPTSAAKNK